MSFKNAVIVAALLFAGIEYAQHGSAGFPQGHSGGPAMKAELENDEVQVVRVHLDPHEKVPVHDVTPRVVIWLTDAHLRATTPDGSSIDEHGKPGQVDWVPAQRHAAENLDDHPVEFIAVIPKTHATGHVPK